MQFIREYFRQTVPKERKECPLYYRRAITWSECLLTVYFLIYFFLLPIFNESRWEWVPLCFLAASAGAATAASHLNVKNNILAFFTISLAWTIWSNSAFGWSSGSQQLLLLVLVLEFFNIYDKPLIKILWLFLLLIIRLGMFFYTRSTVPTRVLSARMNEVGQILNSGTAFLMMAGICISFSSSIQDTERQLRLKNQALYKEAGTDPLTGLPNRRAMIEMIENVFAKKNGESFSIAIADIDFFKKVNDTYGHSCGDYTLVKLTELFLEHSVGRYRVCRWGGEEFCFFIPGMNIDEAAVVMKDLCFSVENMKLNYEGKEFSITLTIGVEEYDFSSPLDKLLEAADQKLYMGKKQGRNQVVF